MIPTSPLIPPYSNNGGYFWNSWGFNGGTTVGATTGGAFVAGESTLASASLGPVYPAGATLCPPGFVFGTPGVGGLPNNTCFVPATGGAGMTPSDTVTPVECSDLDGTFISDPGSGTPGTGYCYTTSLTVTAATPGGLSLSNFGYCGNLGGGGTAGGSPTDSVDVANITGFVPGETVEVYSSIDGHTIVTGLRLTAVIPFTGGTTNGYGPGAPAGTLVFDPASIPPTLCVLATRGVFVSEQTAIPLTANDISGASIYTGDEIDLTEPAGALPAGAVATTSTTVFSGFTVSGTQYGPAAGVPYTFTGVGCGPTASDCILVNGSEALARTLGGCAMSRGSLSGPYTPGLCEPGIDYLEIGTLVAEGPTQYGAPAGSFDDDDDVLAYDPTTGGKVAGAQGPYPFWQWIPNTPSGTSRARAATVYSDNHGEAVVSLETGILSSLLPNTTTYTTNGGCPTGYTPVPSATAATSCLLNYSTLGTSSTPGGTPFAGIAGALAGFSSTAPGCGTYNASTGTFTAAPSATPLADGSPAAGQICVNNLGGLDLGQGAVLGTTTVQATADYPYFKLHPAIASATITKIFSSKFAKTVTVTPGTPCNPSSTSTTGCGIPGPAGTTTFTVTITATDICGNPIVGEPVDVYALGNAGAVVLAPGGANVTGTSTSTATAVLDANGSATLTLEVLNTAIGTQGLVIKAVFPRESLERFATVIPGTLPNQTFTALYGAGWNQIGGPPGSNFSSAESVYLYNPSTQQYTAATSSDNNLSSAAPGCTGYWAYFAAITGVSLPATSTSGQTAACTLAAGWNLVGNPFATPAKLPANVTAYNYSPTTQTYSVVGAIPAGGSVWIFNDGTLNTVTLTAT
jgi:hypothetical protein